MFWTPLINFEEKLGANLGEFAGWKMPMTYTSYQEEHMAVRTKSAFFDLSHMGRLRITGKLQEFENLVAKKVSDSSPGTMVGPTAFLNDKAGFVDDVMTYKVSESEFLVVTNAINREKVINWIRKNSSLEVEDLTFDLVMIALQGRGIWEVAEKPDLSPLQFKLNAKFEGHEVFLLSRSGWTGEDGLEFWAKPEVAQSILERLIARGVKGAGLVARDSLRQEMGFVLYGEDIGEDVNPVEARYWVYSLDKDFIGKGALLDILRTGVDRLRIGIKLPKNQRVIPRNSSKIKIAGKEVGYVTSSTFSPYLSRVIGMGYLSSRHFLMGGNAEVEVRGKDYSVKLSDFPLFK
ncbi:MULTISPECIES: glycine cleavage system aminomethyltransferase GcvT [Metallosphaera]|uniref:aminomethyltransferase n=3 Tax=Metallosphaera TaxID=41980 RepID=A4YHB6_METS5|nr:MULTISPECIES: glycine cleavage system aminomethyltransferase GcvT [Metallosphaera]ABP95818.1 aminomethyltransferase [Metallosphaera sedula DSM 5348]AIM27802.1 aminomethyltransferase [Metallosphaera sedula]AKV74651.1 glycine cleavage system protein T [Metallosphaera sedula]AKV76888.1 glycine cleavage system protein T [Metallosphaera sedula]AKV79139.1 glycine cleavage system protein T [Metallosphaera sedula]